MSNTLHHVDSVYYGYLTPESIDFVLECVRDANEVLFASEALSARDMIVIARSVLECEQLFTQDPKALTHPNVSVRSDWTLACVAGAMATAADKLRGDAAQRARRELRAVLQRIAHSSLRSPAVSYTSVLSALVHDFPCDTPTERLTLLRLAIIENLDTPTESNVIGLLCEVGDCFMQLGVADLALHIYLSLLRFDPASIPIHLHIEMRLRDSTPEIALAAAERALLLLPRDDDESSRPYLRRSIAELRAKPATELSAFGRSLLAELKGKPGKKARIALRTLCMEVDPQIARLPEREPEPLPDVAELAQLRGALKAFPLPFPTHVERAEPPIAELKIPQRLASAQIGPTTKIGRNEHCPCGSGKKWKRCCGAPRS